MALIYTSLGFQTRSLSLFLVFISYKAISHILRKRLRAKLTILDDLPLLSTLRDDKDKIQGTAVICGGSVAGLFAARVCSNHFQKVVIIEAEEWLATADGLQDRHRDKSDNPQPKRSHVAQYVAGHAFYSIISLALQRLFPNVKEEFGRGGGRISSTEIVLHLSGVPQVSPEFPKGTHPPVIFVTRPLFETTLRRMVLEQCPNVTYQSGTVHGIIRSNSSTNQLAGVKFRFRHGKETHISASLVVDCTGPALGGLRWLKDLPPCPNAPSTTAPPGSLSLKDLKITYHHKMTYTTCDLEVPPRLFGKLNRILGVAEDAEFDATNHIYYYFPNAKVERTSFIVQRREHNVIQIIYGGWGMHERRTGITGIKDFLSEMSPAQPLPDWLFEMLDLFEQEDLSATYVFSRCPPAVYVQYHRAHNLPSNFVAVGDSVMQTNPLFGEGCAKACVGAVTLNAMLSRLDTKNKTGSEDIIPSNFSRKYFAANKDRIGHSWNYVRGADYNFKTTVPVPGEDLETTQSWSRAYTGALMRLTCQDKHVAGVMYQTAYWLAPITDLFSPSIVAKVAWATMRDFIGI